MNENCTQLNCAYFFSRSARHVYEISFSLFYFCAYKLEEGKRVGFTVAYPRWNRKQPVVYRLDLLILMRQ